MADAAEDAGSVVFSDDLHPPVELVRAFYCAHATWKVPTELADWATILRHSDAVVSVWEGAELAGMARGLSDHVRWGTVVDVLVHPRYRRQGVGAGLMRRLLAQPVMRVSTIYLATPDAGAFYEKLGFRRANNAGEWLVLVRDRFASDFVLPMSESG